MDLKETIAQLDRQAAQFTEAANALRALLPEAGNSGAGTGTSSTSQEASAPRRRGRQPGSKNKNTGSKSGRPKKVVSPETRAKIAAAIKASHDRRRAAREGNSDAPATAS